ncbi:NAD-dependent glycerol-3-phosphate dehydrogenase [Scenedesmus sp. NREL 46B-D3]|nr:NAD-dependent glycerol-3-phosphate dehydrogenase [Scenedesmus sp. NREL 46B-D3]
MDGSLMSEQQHDWHETVKRTASKLCRAVGVIGAGSYGTALAIHCARAGHPTVIWCRSQEVADEINTQHTNSRRLPGHSCPKQLSATTDLEGMVRASMLLLLAVPSAHIAATAQRCVEHLLPEAVLVCCAKGITTETLQTMEELLLEVVPRPQHCQLAYLSGPSFAAEVAAGMPTGLTIAAREESVAKQVQWWLSAANLRCYRTTDVVGLEFGGALKNVIAIACGMADGKGYGANGRAMIITRGLHEMTRLAVAKGANPMTLGGLGGMGDLILTCTGDASRNRTLGYRLGQGESMASILAGMHGAVAEGVSTTRAAKLLADRLGLQVPIISGLYKILYEDADIDDVVRSLLCLPLTSELDSRMFSYEPYRDSSSTQQQQQASS